jgi:hypothetical protein
VIDRGQRLPAVEVEQADGSPIELGAFLDRMLVVVAIRYYG